MDQIAHPLYSLTKKGAPWIWTKECEAAFNELRYKLINEPVTLAFPDWNDVYYVEADGSGIGVAAVLSQKISKLESSCLSVIFHPPCMTPKRTTGLSN